MFKEFEKLVGKVDVQIHLSKTTEQENGLHARIIFIPLVKGLPLKNLIPVEVWGDREDVENSIRYNIEMLNTAFDVQDDVQNEVQNYVQYPFNEGDDYWTIDWITKSVVKSCWDDVSVENHTDDKVYYKTEAEADEALAPTDKILVVKSKPLPSAKELAMETLKQKETEASTIAPAIERCPKCELPKDSVEKGECIYPGCPDGKYKGNGPNLTPLTPEEAFLSEKMQEEEEKCCVDPCDPEYGHCNSIDNEGENDNPWEQEDEEIAKDQVDMDALYDELDKAEAEEKKEDTPSEDLLDPNQFQMF